MKSFVIAVLLSFATFNIYAQQEIIEQVLAGKSFNVSEEKNSSSESYSINESRIGTFLSRKIKSYNSKNNIKKTQRIEAYSVVVTALEGFSFHVADYYDGTRVVTCLDGEMEGVQEIAVNGVKTTRSTCVETFQDHFVHHYQHGNVYSYPDKQIIELYL